MSILEPTSIDPYRAQEIEGVGVVKQLFAGLVASSPRGQLIPAAAASWERADDGLTWIFRLRGDARFSTGEPVDAESFVRGVNRALDPAADTETSYHAAGIKGFAAVADGSREKLSGLHAPDPRTLVVELDRPDFEFAAKTLQPLFSPVPRDAGPAADPAFNDRPVGNGPFMLAEPWRHGESITLVRNPHWAGPPVRLTEVRIDILSGEDALAREYEGFEQGRYDYARVPADQVERARARYGAGGGFLERDLPGLHYLIPFCHQAPLAHAAARRAVSLAVDRAAIGRELFGGSRRPAGTLISPWFAEVHDPAAAPGVDGFDPAAARQVAAEAGLVPGTKVDLAVNLGSGHEAWVRAVAAQLTTHLDLHIEVLEMTSAELLAHRTSAAAAGLCRAGWAYDYPTPDNLLFPLLHSTCTNPDADGVAHGDNEGRYVSADFDAAVDRARSLRDDAARAAAWREAERIALADAALIPLWYRTEHRVVAADRFSGIDLDFFGNPTLAEAAPADAGQAPTGI